MISCASSPRRRRGRRGVARRRGQRTRRCTSTEEALQARLKGFVARVRLAAKHHNGNRRLLPREDGGSRAARLCAPRQRGRRRRRGARREGAPAAPARGETFLAKRKRARRRGRGRRRAQGEGESAGGGGGAPARGTANQARRRLGADAKYLKGRRRLRRATVARREVRKARVKTTLEATREVTRGLRPGGRSRGSRRRGGVRRRSRRWRWRNTAWCCATARRRSKATRAAARCGQAVGPDVIENAIENRRRAMCTNTSCEHLLHTRARSRASVRSRIYPSDGGAVGDGGAQMVTMPSGCTRSPRRRGRRRRRW